MPQRAFTLAGTLADNILMGRERDEKRLSAVLDACAMEQDLEKLPLLPQQRARDYHELRVRCVKDLFKCEQVCSHRSGKSGVQEEALNLARTLLLFDWA